MALISCGWCKHDVIWPDNHAWVGHSNVGAPKWCSACRFCTAELDKNPAQSPYGMESPAT